MGPSRDVNLTVPIDVAVGPSWSVASVKPVTEGSPIAVGG